MSATGEFYGSIIRNAGLDECEDASWDRLEAVLNAAPADVITPVDVFDYAVDELMTEEGYYAETLSLRTLIDAAGLALILLAAYVFGYALCLAVAR
jgi:hypothetical protein